MLRKFFLILTFSLFLVGESFSISLPGYNSYQKHVSDFANVLSPSEEQNLQRRLEEFERQTSIQVAIVIENDLQDESIETYANELFNKWGIGDPNLNNGLLILISPANRAWKTEVGYGLEYILTDNTCSRISKSNYPKNFKRRDYFEGISGAIDDYIEKLGGMSWTQRQDNIRQEKEARAESERKIAVARAAEQKRIAEEERLAAIEYERLRPQREKESAEFWAGVGTFFLWLFGLGIAVAVSLFVYSSIRKKQKEEEDRLAEIKRKREEAERREREKIQYLQQLEEIQENFSKVVKNLWETYKAHDENLLNTKKLYETAKAEVAKLDSLPRSVDGDSTNEEIYSVIKSFKNTEILINDTIKKIKSNPAKAETIKAKFVELKNKASELEVANKETKVILDELGLHPNSIWGTNLLTRAIINNEYYLFINIVKDNEEFVSKNEVMSEARYTDISNINEHLSQLSVKISNFLETARNKRKEVRKAQDIVNSIDQNSFDQSYRRAQETSSRSYVTPYTRKKLDQTRELQKRFYSGKFDVIESANFLTQIYDGYEFVIKQSDRDISDYHAEQERQRREAEERERRRRRDEEERERRRRREAEEEAERLRQSYYSSNSSSYSSGSSSSSWDSGSSFDGGSSGGGGDSGGW